MLFPHAAHQPRPPSGQPPQPPQLALIPLPIPSPIPPGHNQDAHTQHAQFSTAYTTLLFHAFIISFVLIMLPFLTYYAFFRWRKRIRSWWERIGNRRDNGVCSWRGRISNDGTGQEKNVDEELGISGGEITVMRMTGEESNSCGKVGTAISHTLVSSVRGVERCLDRFVGDRVKTLQARDRMKEGLGRALLGQQRAVSGPMAFSSSSSSGVAGNAGNAVGMEITDSLLQGWLRKRSLGGGMVAQTMPPVRQSVVTPGGRPYVGNGIVLRGGDHKENLEWYERISLEHIKPKEKEQYWWRRWMKNQQRGLASEPTFSRELTSGWDIVHVLQAPVTTPWGSQDSLGSPLMGGLESRRQQERRSTEFRYLMRGGKREETFDEQSEEKSCDGDAVDGIAELIAPTTAERDGLAFKEGTHAEQEERELDMQRRLGAADGFDGPATNGDEDYSIVVDPPSSSSDNTSLEQSATSSTTTSPESRLYVTQLHLADRLGLAFHPPHPITPTSPNIGALISPPTRHQLLHKIFEPSLRQGYLLPPLSRFVLEKWKKHNTPLCHEEPGEEDGRKMVENNKRNRKDRMLRLRSMEEDMRYCGVDGMLGFGLNGFGRRIGRRCSDPGVRELAGRLWLDAVDTVRAGGTAGPVGLEVYYRRGLGLPYIPEGIPPGWESEDERVYSLLHSSRSGDRVNMSDEDVKIVLRHITRQKQREMTDLLRSFSEDMFLKEVDRRLEWWWCQAGVMDGGLAAREYHRRQDILLVEEGRKKVGDVKGGREGLEMDKEYFDRLYIEEMERNKGWFEDKEWRCEMDAPEGVRDPGAYCFPRPPGRGQQPPRTICMGKKSGLQPIGLVEPAAGMLGLRHRHLTAGLGDTSLGQRMIERAKRLLGGDERMHWPAEQAEAKKKWEEAGGVLRGGAFFALDGEHDSIQRQGNVRVTSMEIISEDCQYQCSSLKGGDESTSLDDWQECFESDGPECAELEKTDGHTHQQLGDDAGEAYIGQTRGRSRIRVVSGVKGLTQKERLLRNTPPSTYSPLKLPVLSRRRKQHHCLSGSGRIVKTWRKRALSIPAASWGVRDHRSSASSGYIAGDEENSSDFESFGDVASTTLALNTPSSVLATSGESSRAVSFGTDATRDSIDSILSVESVSSGYGDGWSWGRMGLKTRGAIGTSESGDTYTHKKGYEARDHEQDDKGIWRDDIQADDVDLDLEKVRGSWGRDGGYLMLNATAEHPLVCAEEEREGWIIGEGERGSRSGASGGQGSLRFEKIRRRGKQSRLSVISIIGVGFNEGLNGRDSGMKVPLAPSEHGQHRGEWCGTLRLEGNDFSGTTATMATATHLHTAEHAVDNYQPHPIQLLNSPFSMTSQSLRKELSTSTGDEIDPTNPWFLPIVAGSGQVVPRTIPPATETDSLTCQRGRSLLAPRRSQSTIGHIQGGIEVETAGSGSGRQRWEGRAMSAPSEVQSQLSTERRLFWEERIRRGVEVMFGRQEDGETVRMKDVDFGENGNP